MAEQGRAAEVLRPVLDTYLSAAVGITGCHSYGISRACCEYDVVIVTNEQRAPASVKMGYSYMDISFLSEKEILKPTDPELAVSLAWLQHVRDSTLVLSTSSSANRAVLHENARRAAENRLRSALKAIGRVDESISKGLSRDADFWLLSAAYDFAYAWLLSAEVAPAPSHVLEQLKKQSMGRSGWFKAFLNAAGLSKASRRGSARRLEGLSIIFDVLGTRLMGEQEGQFQSSVRTEFEILRQKAAFLTESIRHVDCYAYLGFVVVGSLPRISGPLIHEPTDADRTPVVTALTEGEGRLIADSVVANLGLLRTDAEVIHDAVLMRDSVSELAKTF